eukprot:gene348-441_t
MQKLTPAEIKKGTDILSAWTILEILSPQNFKKAKELAKSTRQEIIFLTQGEKLPWEQETKEKRVFYQIVIGLIDYEAAIKLLVKKYPQHSTDEDYEAPDMQEEKSIMGILTVDYQGKLIKKENHNLILSTFAWGIPQILQEHLKKICDWPAVEEELQRIKKHILTNLIKKDKDEQPLPLTLQSINQAYADLTQAFGLDQLSDTITIDHKFALKCYPDSANDGYPKPIMLNSFFMEDLLKATQLIKENNAPETLLRYLKLIQPEKQHDIFHTTDLLEEVVSPNNIPLAQWPSPQGKELVLLQQAAVNIAMNKLHDGELLGINGPPGTGKTTLLRDIVATIIYQRAEKMATFDHPELAFTQLDKPITLKNSDISLYSLNNLLKGFEILIASSNNKAVENISAELPGEDTIDKALGLTYFKTISDALSQKGDPTWGLISAVLGNSNNLNAFYQQFKDNQDTSLDTYLLAALGEMPPEIQDQQTKQDRPARILTENTGFPTNPKEAQAQWQKARAAFKEISTTTKKELDALEELRHKIHTLKALQSDPAFFNATTQAPVKNPICKPNWLFKILQTTSTRTWEKEEEKRTQWAKLNAEVNNLSNDFKGTIIDDHFFKLTDKERQTTIPWIDENINKLRKQVFVEAIKLHQAFITAAAKPIRSNLNTFMEILGNKGDAYLRGRTKEHMAALWATFFLVVPAISTTFASAGKMLQDILPSTLGWLLIDEAGQATTQAAVGAIMRSKKVIVTGDPLQIKPVVKLPNNITAAICQAFELDQAHFDSHQASVQTLADKASPFCTKFFIPGIGERTVGVPLLVHRRCANPMFDISNVIAYCKKMVYGRSGKTSEIKNCLGPSQWLDVKGGDIDKWAPEEDTQVLALLTRLKDQGISPDVCIISPFRNVADKLRTAIRASNMLKDWLSPKEIEPWLEENVGTIHTMQGREKEAVILVLGAQNSPGARNWAGKEPNILNVAVTRAKEVIYVVGNRALWKSCGVFEELHKSLPTTTAPEITPNIALSYNEGPMQHQNELFISNEPFDEHAHMTAYGQNSSFSEPNKGQPTLVDASLLNG